MIENNFYKWVIWCKISVKQNYEGEDANCQTLIWAFDLKFGRREIILSSKTFWKPKLSCFWIGEKFKTKKIRALLVWLIAYNTLSPRKECHTDFSLTMKQYSDYFRFSYDANQSFTIYTKLKVLHWTFNKSFPLAVTMKFI